MEQKNITTADGVTLRRVGYVGTGFSFTFAKCPSENSFRRYVRKLPGVVFEAWMADQTEDVPTGFTVMNNAPVIPGTVEEADGSFLCEVHIVVRGDCDAGEEKRRWYHEIGHAVDFATKSGHRVASDIEFPAYCNEFLCSARDVFKGFPDHHRDEILSGFPHLFPYLAPGTGVRK